MRLSRRLIYIGIIALIAVALWWINRAPPVEVNLHTVTSGSVESTIANTRTGTIMACRRSHIAPIISGRVEQLRVKKGDEVKAGQLLLSLWSDDLAAQLRLTHSQANAAKAHADEVCVIAELAQRDAERIKTLQRKGLTSEESYDQAQNNAIAREASCRAANASVDVAKAQRQVAEAALQRTSLNAPFDGIIAEVHAELGEVLAPLSTESAMGGSIDIIEKGCLYISAPIDEIDAPTVQAGMQAKITLDAFPGETFNGTVHRIAPYVLDVEKQARTVEVEVEFSDPKIEQQMLPGYSTDVEVVLKRRTDTLWIPNAALLRDDKVWLYVEGKLEKRSLKIGLSNWQTSEVISGLSEGEQIILPSGNIELSEKMPVQPMTKAD